MNGVRYDSLLGGTEQPTYIRNVKISSDTTVERGTLLAGTFDGSDVKVHVALAADATNGSELFISTEEAAGASVIGAYESGVFNRSAIKSAGDVRAFEKEMRRQGLWLKEELK